MKISKRYVDIFEKCIHKGENTPLSLGTLVVCCMCFLFIIIATFTQLTFSHYWFGITNEQNFGIVLKTITYNPQIPILMFIIYLLGRKYSILVYTIYLLIGFFLWPVFVYGGGLGYFKNYLFGYTLGVIFAIILSGTIISKEFSIKARLLAGLTGTVAIHLCGIIYCVILAIFGIIDFNLIGAIFKVVTIDKILYDLIFTLLIMLVAPYIKNIFWIAMGSGSSKKRKSKRY